MHLVKIRRSFKVLVPIMGCHLLQNRDIYHYPCIQFHNVQTKDFEMKLCINSPKLPNKLLFLKCKVTDNIICLNLKKYCFLRYCPILIYKKVIILLHRSLFYRDIILSLNMNNLQIKDHILEILSDYLLNETIYQKGHILASYFVPPGVNGAKSSRRN